MYRVIKNYEARTSKELDLTIGEALQSVQPYDDQVHAFGTLGSRTGHFPLECIEPCISQNKQLLATLGAEEYSLNDSTDSENESPFFRRTGSRNYAKQPLSRSNSNRYRRYQVNFCFHLSSKMFER